MKLQKLELNENNEFIVLYMQWQNAVTACATISESTTSTCTTICLLYSNVSYINLYTIVGDLPICIKINKYYIMAT